MSVAAHDTVPVHQLRCWCGHGKGLHRWPTVFWAWAARRYGTHTCLGHQRGASHMVWCACTGWRPR